MVVKDWPEETAGMVEEKAGMVTGVEVENMPSPGRKHVSLQPSGSCTGSRGGGGGGGHWGGGGECGREDGGDEGAGGSGGAGVGSSGDGGVGGSIGLVVMLSCTPAPPALPLFHPSCHRLFHIQV
eukprot:5975526-Prymnesium_polylepis.2